MQFISLKIKLVEDIPDFRVGLMHEITSWLADNGYHPEIIRDKSTRSFQEDTCGAYVFEKNRKNENELSLDKVKEYLDLHKTQILEYKLIDF